MFYICFSYPVFTVWFSLPKYTQLSLLSHHCGSSGHSSQCRLRGSGSLILKFVTTKARGGKAEVMKVDEASKIMAEVLGIETHYAQGETSCGFCPVFHSELS